MNSLERYLATIEGRPVDHLARVPILMQFAAEHIGSHYGAFASDYRVLTEANLVCARDFGIEQVSTISDPLPRDPYPCGRGIFDPGLGRRSRRRSHRPAADGQLFYGPDGRWSLRCGVDGFVR